MEDFVHSDRSPILPIDEETQKYFVFIHFE